LTDRKRLGLLVLLGGGVTLLLWYLAPWAVPHRIFGGEGVLLNPFGHHLPQGRLPQGYQDAWLYPVFYLSLAWLALSLLLPWTRAGVRGLYWAGALGLGLFLLTYLLFQGSVAQANAGAERPLLRRFSLGLGSYATLAYGLYLPSSPGCSPRGGSPFWCGGGGWWCPSSPSSSPPSWAGPSWPS